MTRSFLLVDSVRNNNIPETVEEEEVKETCSEFTDLLSSMLNPKVLKDPKFLLIGVSNFFGFLGFYVPFVYLPSMAESRRGQYFENIAMICNKKLCSELKIFLEIFNYVNLVCSSCSKRPFSSVFLSIN